MLIVANWKMHKTINETRDFINNFYENFKNKEEFAKKNKIILCVPFICIDEALKQIRNKNIDNLFIAAQNCYFEKEGAFTGEISAYMLKKTGIKYVILGHSERRLLFSETDEIINKKVLSCLKEDLSVILCIGENLEQKNKRLTEEILSNQLIKALKGVSKYDLDKIIVAYEPVWAIGTKKSASCLEISKIARYIKEEISIFYGKDKNLVKIIKVLYGGSVNTENANKILKAENLDGILVGKASLNYEDFLKIIYCAK